MRKILTSWKIAKMIVNIQDEWNNWQNNRFWEEITLKKMQEFIAFRVNVNAKDNNGQVPLHFAVHGHTQGNDNIEIVRLLIKAGADIHCKNKRGATPLHVAAANNGNPHVIKELINAGADVNAKNSNGFAPLHGAAARNGNPRVIKELIKAGADVNAKNNDGNTPLHTAALINENIEVIKELIKAGAVVNAEDDAGKTPYDYLLKNDTFKDKEEAIALLKPKP